MPGLELGVDVTECRVEYDGDAGRREEEAIRVEFDGYRIERVNVVVG